MYCERARLDGGAVPRPNNYIGRCIMKICNGLSLDWHFREYSQHWKEDMVCDAVENCCAAIDNFNPEKSNNAFGYFTQIAYNAFLRRIDKERKQQYVKHKNKDRLALFDHDPQLETGMIGTGQNPAGHREGEVAHNNIVASYEATLARRKLKKSEKSETDQESRPRPFGGVRRGGKTRKQTTGIEREDLSSETDESDL